ERLSEKASWDYLIGSVHYIAPGWDVDNPKHLSRFKQYPVDEIWDLYWNHYVRCIESGLFDFVAHPDLPKNSGTVHRAISGVTTSRSSTLWRKEKLLSKSTPPACARKSRKLIPRWSFFSWHTKLEWQWLSTRMRTRRRRSDIDLIWHEIWRGKPDTQKSVV